MDLQRAYALFEIKAVDDEQRVIEGIASTPTPDRMDDIVEPAGAMFTLPIPLLWQHESRDAAIGEVFAAKATKDGIQFKARIASDDQPGPLKDRLDYAWRAIKKKLVRGVSIGFNALESADITGSYGRRFTKWDWLELSAVTIPANAEATIHAVKQHASPPPASGVGRPAVAGHSVKMLTTTTGKAMLNIQEQIKGFEATRQAKAARQLEIQEVAAKAGRTKDEAEQEEFDTISADVKALDRELKDLRELEKSNLEAAKPVTSTAPAGGTTLHGGNTQSAGHTVVARAGSHNMPKGTAFTRYAMALAAGKGSLSDALRHAERWKESSPEVIAHLQGIRTKAEPGTTTDDVYGWAAPLVYQTNLVAEFIDLLRPATILGKMTGIRNVPFNVRIPVQTGGSTVNWVGEAAPKPVSQLEFDSITLGYHKVAGIVVLTDELVRLSTPSAEEAVRRDLVEQTVRFIDFAFIDPSASATANNPASITQGVAGSGASGVDAEALYADINAALATFDDTDLGTGNMFVLMRPGTARGIAALRNPLGQFEFTGVTPVGGTLMGFPVITSNTVPSGYIILVKADEVLLADDGSVTLDASREATLDMNGGDTPNFNLWQRNCVGIRAERGLTWAKRRPDAVAVITGAAYGPELGS